MNRDELVRYLDKYLGAQEGADYCPNGLQVEGCPEIRKIVTGVSACQELFERAHEAGADAVMVHHGIFWKGMPQELTGYRFQRVAALVHAEMNLLAYHLPLDRHPELGNNALAARALGLVEMAPFGDYKGLPVGFAGRFPSPVTAQELVRRCETFYEQAPRVFDHGPEEIRSLAIISGAAQSELHEAVAAGYDAFLTGEVSEWVMNVARECRVHYLAAGHYATERCGIRALGEHLAERFEVEVEFVDVWNPV